MPVYVAIPNGVDKNGNTKYKKVVGCRWTKDCSFTDVSISVVREHEKEHK